jgi:hypothetical protein
MNFKKFYIFRESFDNSYPYRFNLREEEIEAEDDETGEVYNKTVMQPVQIVQFKTEDGTPFVWYAKQDRFSDTTWEIAFGVDKQTGKSEDSFKLDIQLTNKGNAFRIFSTIIDITNTFIEYDSNDYQVQTLKFSSEGDKRTEFYLKHLVPRIDNFKINHEYTWKSGDETIVYLDRKF